jgi:uncharacterized membrane protein
MARPALSDHGVEQGLARLLQTGVVLAAAVVLAGGLRYLATHGAGHPQYGTFSGEPEDLSRIDGIVRAAAAFRGRGLIQLGLLLLIATPVARVAFSLVAFVLQRDRTYVMLTAFVLLLLLASLAGIVA